MSESVDLPPADLPPAEVVVVGAGPAGLMAAEVAAAAGRRVAVIERMPTPARKLLLAGRGGLNLTHTEPLGAFFGRYGRHAALLAPYIERFPPERLRGWAHGLGIDTFVGSSGRVFPVGLKASGLVRAWLRRLDGLGVVLHTRQRWLGWRADGALRLLGPDGAERGLAAGAVLLALGGGSWPRTGSDGGWREILAAEGVPLVPFRPANMGFAVPWTERFRAEAEGKPVKNVALGFGGRRVRGEFVVTRDGIEGGAVYALSAPLRDALEREGGATLLVDLLPELEPAAVRARLARPRGAESHSTHLRKALRLPDVAFALLRERTSLEEARDPERLARLVKALPLPLTAAAGLERAISTAGGVPWSEVDDRLMLKRRPGTFIAGEMLDWEAPTGGYLLQACFALGAAAGTALAGWSGESAQPNR